MLIIDTHAHIYSPDEKKYPVIEKPLRPPAGKGSLEHLRRETLAHGVAKACLVQTSTFYGFDNRYTMDSAKAAKEWSAGICTLSPDNPESPALLKKYVREFNARGMRSIAAKDGRLDHPGVRALWTAAADLGIVINVLTGREKAPEVDRLLAEYKTLQVVLDHCLGLKAGPAMAETLATVLQLSLHSNLNAKLTFIPTGSGGRYPCGDMHEACMRIVGAFGAGRCVWGSDFPMELWAPRVGYAEHLRIFATDLPLKSAERELILGGTATRLWFS
ncbi:MAG: amidohydrolase family protein [Bryobacteraceae bacterium]